MAGSLNCTVDVFQSFLSANASSAMVNFATTLGQNASFNPLNSTEYPTGLPASCAIQVTVPTEGNASYVFGMFLPEDWNGRFLGAAAGGGVNWVDMATATLYGFATVGSDTGHPGSDTAGVWAIDNPEGIIDWAWRANHGATVLGKLLIEQWYGSAPSYSYFTGCSTGGKQGMKELQMFPEDYNGVISGAPAWWTTHNQLYNLKQTTFQAPANSSHTIPASMLSVLAEEVLKQCDPQDGLIDTVINNPLGCVFNPLTLACTDNGTDCLTEPQLETVRKIYNDWVDVNQTYVYSHILLGSEAGWANGNIGTGEELNIEAQYWYIRDVMGLGDSFTWHDLDYDLVLLADELNPGNASADNYDISPFAERGGKFIHYHGLSDAVVAPGASIYYYDHVTAEILPKGIEVDSFYRMFLVPGMEHCGSTPTNTRAPWYFAAPNQPAMISTSTHSTPGFQDARHDILLALMAWVENGTAPDALVATVWEEDLVPDSGVYRQRPICRWPLVAKYNGTGDQNASDSWNCEELY